LWAVFHDPERLRPKETRAGITKEAADKFSTIALRLQGRGTPEEVAHFVNQLVFCFFANSVKLLPEGFFPKLLKRAGQRPDRAQDTDPEKIMMIVEPVILRPLRAEWEMARAETEKLVEAAHLKKGRAFDNAMAKAEEPRAKFLERLRKVTILDPACGSGNFLYL